MSNTNIEHQASPVSRAIGNALRDRGFVVAALILLVAAAGLNASVGALRLHFQKVSVPLRRPLADLPEKLGPWVQVSKDQPLNPDMEHELGTDKYIFRDYVDSRIVPQSVIEQFTNRNYNERMAMFNEIRLKNPRAVMNLAVTYYTGLVDTVAHIPDRCYIADGYQPVEYKIVNDWSAFQDRPGRSTAGDARYINFEDQTAERKAIPKNVAYFFHCNGGYVSAPEQVRMRLQDLRQKYGYYSKVELMTLMPDREASARTMNDFLTYALPEIERCLPDWDNVGKTTATTPASPANTN
jgi:hypothetical protein